EAFLATPEVEIAAIAPATVITGFGGTRRGAALAGVDPLSKAYMPWVRHGILACLDLLFRHGVCHAIVPIPIVELLEEAAGSRARLFAALDWVFAGTETLADYVRREWRVRLIGAEGIAELAATAERLRAATPSASGPTLWLSVCADAEAPMRAIIDTALQTGARTRAEAIRALYGEDIPLATMLIGFGRPTFTYDLIPPLLVGRLQCYWMQRPGYGLDERMLRRILYDYAYTRDTGSGTDRSGRYANVQAQRAAWETDWVLGAGVPLGAFWYPAPFAGPPEESLTHSY
ncbi:MAG TPA: hypothetical protein VGJ87_22675, partial [Roseiflexaceae bacterium]